MQATTQIIAISDSKTEKRTHTAQSETLLKISTTA